MSGLHRRPDDSDARLVEDRRAQAVIPNHPAKLLVLAGERESVEYSQEVADLRPGKADDLWRELADRDRRARPGGVEVDEPDLMVGVGCVPDDFKLGKLGRVEHLGEVKNLRACRKGGARENERRAVDRVFDRPLMLDRAEKLMVRFDSHAGDELHRLRITAASTARGKQEKQTDSLG